MTDRVVAYLRDSGGRDQELSIDQQEKKIVEFCQSNNLALTRIYRDAARPGSTTATRTEFLAMMTYLVDPACQETGVIVWSFSRLARDFDDHMHHVSSLRRAGRTVYSLTDPVPDTLDGRVMESIIAWKNARYREDMSRDIRRGQHYVVEIHHAFLGPKPPTGYKLVQAEIGEHRLGGARTIQRLEINDTSAPLVRQAFSLRANGATISEILQAIPALNMRPMSLGRMLRKRLYTGVMEYAGSLVPDFCPAIIDEDTWTQAQAVNLARRERFGYNHPRTVRSGYILTGLLFCGKCGRPMHGCNRRQFHFYRCGSETNGGKCGALQIPQAEIEQRVVSIVSNTILSDSLLKDLYAEMQVQAGQSRQAAIEQRESMRRERASLTARIARLVNAIGDAGHSPALLDELSKVENRQREIDVLLLSDIPDVELPPWEWVVDRAQAMIDTQPRELLRTWVDRVTAERIKMDDRYGRWSAKQLAGIVRIAVPGGVVGVEKEL